MAWAQEMSSRQQSLANMKGIIVCGGDLPRKELVLRGLEFYGPLELHDGKMPLSCGIVFMSTQPQPGSKAPSFTAPVIGGEYPESTIISLRDFLGHTVVLYFYPKDDTPGCTKQACALRDGWADISAKAKVFGVSIDPIKSHEKFIKKHQLPFPIISDDEKAIVEAYGVWVEKSMYGKTYFGTERTTFIIDPKGKIKAVLAKVKPDEHLSQVLALLD